jgi:hypothetical protein
VAQARRRRRVGSSPASGRLRIVEALSRDCYKIRNPTDECPNPSAASANLALVGGVFATRCADTTCAEPAHVGCAHAAEILSAEAVAMGFDRGHRGALRRGRRYGRRRNLQGRSVQPTSTSAPDLRSRRSALCLSERIGSAVKVAARVSSARCCKREHDGQIARQTCVLGAAPCFQAKATPVLPNLDHNFAL